MSATGLTQEQLDEVAGDVDLIMSLCDRLMHKYGESNVEMVLLFGLRGGHGVDIRRSTGAQTAVALLETALVTVRASAEAEKEAAKALMAALRSDLEKGGDLH